MPNEGLNQISQENENIKRHIEQLSLNYEEQIYALRQELSIRESEASMRQNADEQRFREISQKYEKLEKHHLGLTKVKRSAPLSHSIEAQSLTLDRASRFTRPLLSSLSYHLPLLSYLSRAQEFFQLKFKCNQKEQRLHEENELLRLRNTALANKLLILEKTTQIENKTAQELVEKRSEEYTSKFRKDVVKKEEEIQIMKVQMLSLSLSHHFAIHPCPFLSS